MAKRFLYTVLLAAGFSAILSAQSISDLNKRRQKAEEEIAYIDKLLKKNTSDRQNSRQQIALTQQKIKSRKQIIADMDAQIHLLENDLGRKQDDVAGLQANLGTLKQSYEELLYQAYKHRDKRLWLMFLLSSNDAGLAYRRWQYFKNYAKYINEQALKIRETSERLNTEIVSLNEKKEQLATQKSAREKEMTKLTREEAEAQRMIKNLASKEKELARRMADQRKAIERINKQIEKIIADQTRQDQQRRKQTPNLPEIDRALSSGFQNNRGNLPWPVRKGIITKRFGQHFDQVFKNIKLPPNNGIDISTEDHSAVYCIFEGTVSRVFQIPGMNNCVMVQHGEYYTLYCKLSKVGVKAGDKLKAGQSLGTVFTTDEGAELHFEVWKGTTRQNPELWLKK